MTEATRPGVLHELTATETARLIRDREVSPVELVDQLADRATRLDPLLRVWETLDVDGARRAAQTAEAQMARGVDVLGALHGVPFGAKDIFDTAGLRTSAGFPPYADRVPAEDAEVIARLKAAGAIVL